MPQVEAGACGKPVISLNAMGMLDTLIHNKTAFLAEIAKQNVVNDVILGKESGFKKNHKVSFDFPRTVDYRANVQDIAKYLLQLMHDAELRQNMGEAARKHVVENFDYKIVASRFVQIIQDKLGID